MMSEGSRVDTGRRMEAACNKLIDIELNALNGREISSQDNAEQPSSITQTTPRFAELSSSKGNIFIDFRLLFYEEKRFRKFFEPETFT